MIGVKSQRVNTTDCSENHQSLGFWLLLGISQFLTVLIGCGVVLMLFMLAISLTTIKRFQTKHDNHALSILNLQFAMSLMMAAALAILYITVIVVNAR